MSRTAHYSDEQLTAYLDGEADAALAQEIDAAKVVDAELNKRLAALEVDREAIADAFALLLDATPQPPEMTGQIEREDETEANDLAPQASKPRMQWYGIAAGAAMLLVGGLLGYVVSESRSMDWRGYVAAYQALYVNGTLSHIDPVAATQQAELKRVGTALGKSFDLDVLNQVDQLDYKRAQTLGFEGRPLVQLTFLSKVGAPVALCIIRSDNRSSESPQIVIETLEGMQAAHWHNDGYDYLIIGGSDAELIEAAARYFSGKV